MIVVVFTKCNITTSLPTMGSLFTLSQFILFSEALRSILLFGPVLSMLSYFFLWLFALVQSNNCLDVWKDTPVNIAMVCKGGNEKVKESSKTKLSWNYVLDIYFPIQGGQRICEHKFGENVDKPALPF